MNSLSELDPRRDLVARHLHDARCTGCVGMRYSGQHVPLLPSHDLEAADALLVELDALGGAR